MMKLQILNILLAINVIFTVQSTKVINISQKNGTKGLAGSDSTNDSTNKHDDLHYYKNFVNRQLRGQEYKANLKHVEKYLKKSFKAPSKKELKLEFFTNFKERKNLRDIYEKLSNKINKQEAMIRKNYERNGKKAEKYRIKEEIIVSQYQAKLDFNDEAIDGLKHLINHYEKYRETLEHDISNNQKWEKTTLDNKIQKFYDKQNSMEMHKVKHYYNKALVNFSKLLKLEKANLKIENKFFKKWEKPEEIFQKNDAKYESKEAVPETKLFILEVLKTFTKNELNHQEILKQEGFKTRNASKIETIYNEYLKFKEKEYKKEISLEVKSIHEETKILKKID